MGRCGGPRYTSSRLTLATPVRRLARDRYARDAVAVARDLLGKVLVHRDGLVRRAARIVETEAYHGPDDQASHARFGRTPRATIMFGPPGFAYVYLIYGTVELLQRRHRRTRGTPRRCWCGRASPSRAACTPPPGPATCAAPSASAARCTTGSTSPATCSSWRTPRRGAERVVAAPRVNVQYAGPWAERPWRFALEGNAFVSRPRPWAARRR